MDGGNVLGREVLLFAEPITDLFLGGPSAKCSNRLQKPRLHSWHLSLENSKLSGISAIGACSQFPTGFFRVVSSLVILSRVSRGPTKKAKRSKTLPYGLPGFQLPGAAFSAFGCVKRQARGLPGASWLLAGGFGERSSFHNQDGKKGLSRPGTRPHPADCPPPLRGGYKANAVWRKETPLFQNVTSGAALADPGAWAVRSGGVGCVLATRLGGGFYSRKPTVADYPARFLLRLPRPRRMARAGIVASLQRGMKCPTYTI